MTTGGYDNLNRLTAAQATGGPYQGLQASWSYDGFGNRTLENFGGTLVNPSPPGIPGSTVFSYNNYNQILTANPAPAPTYDTGGNVVQDSENQYAYDGEGRLCAVYDGITRTSTGYLYDAEGNRVAKGTIQWVIVNGVSTLSCDTTQNGFTATTAYVHGLGGEQLSEFTNNVGTWNWAHTNIYAGGQLAATYDADSSGQTEGSLYFHLADWLGTRRETTDYSGIPCSTYASLPYGSRLFPGSGPCLANSQDPTEHHFTGKERDSESGNDYFGARYYASSIGRFLSPDPSGESLALSDPQSLNRYTYVLNNPLIMTDPTGLDCVFLNDQGNGVEEVDADTDTSPTACVSKGVNGYYVPGHLTGYSTDSSDPDNQITSLQYSPYQSNADFTGPQPSFGNSYINIDYVPMRLTPNQISNLVAPNNNSGLPDSTIACIVGIESGGNPQAVPLQGPKTADGSPNPYKGLPIPGMTAKGLMQMTRGADQQILNAGTYSGSANTAAQIQADSFNPATGIQTGTDYIAYLVGRFGANWPSHYGAGGLGARDAGFSIEFGCPMSGFSDMGYHESQPGR